MYGKIEIIIEISWFNNLKRKLIVMYKICLYIFNNEKMKLIKKCLYLVNIVYLRVDVIKNVKDIVFMKKSRNSILF